MAAALLAALEEAHASGPFAVGGVGYGSILAYELARKVGSCFTQHITAAGVPKVSSKTYSRLHDQATLVFLNLALCMLRWSGPAS